MGCVTGNSNRSGIFVNWASEDSAIFLGRRKEICVLIAFLSAWLSFAAPFSLKAQVAGGSITGTVRGESGAPMPGVQVSIADVGSIANRTVTTDTDGFYNVPALPPATYEMTVSAPGFVTQVMTFINISVGSERVLNIVMHPGTPETIVRSVAPVAPISQASACCGGSANASTVRDTPLNGRDWAQMATLQAGVTGVQNGSASGGGNTDRGFGAAVSISGSRPEIGRAHV